MCAELKKHEQKKNARQTIKIQKINNVQCTKREKNCDFQLEKFPNEHSQF